MLKQRITVLAQAQVNGPSGKLQFGKVYELDDSPYIRILVKSGTVTLIDPPSLDPAFLELGGYELRDGYTYLGTKETEKKAEAPSDSFLTKVPKKRATKVSEEPISEETVSDENGDNQASENEGTKSSENGVK